MSTQTSRFATQRAALALALLAGLSGCQTPVVVSPPQAAPNSTPDRNAEIARILELKKRGVISDAQAVEILGALVAGDSGAAAPSTDGARPTAPASVAPAAPASV